MGNKISGWTAPNNQSSDEGNCILSLFAADSCQEYSTSDVKTVYTEPQFRILPLKATAKMHCRDPYVKHYQDGDVPIFDFEEGWASIQPLKFPSEYTVMLWVEFTAHGLVTTFDSGSFTPIFFDNKTRKVGVYAYGSRMCGDPLSEDKIYCVFAAAKGSKTRFYLGTLDNGPKDIGTVQKSVAGQTCRGLGNTYNQGPGYVSATKIWNTTLSYSEIKEEYEDSLFEMFGFKKQSLLDTQKSLHSIFSNDMIVLEIMLILCGENIYGKLKK